jgi:heme/copper-type cytochrome/quinol oxidase subunit 3
MTNTKPNRGANARTSFLLAAAVLGACFIGVGLYAWLSFRDSGMSTAAIIMFGIGLLVTLGLGIGLMSLLFYSDRAGYDDDVGGGPSG